MEKGERRRLISQAAHRPACGGDVGGESEYGNWRKSVVKLHSIVNLSPHRQSAAKSQVSALSWSWPHHKASKLCVGE